MFRGQRSAVWELRTSLERCFEREQIEREARVQGELRPGDATRGFMENLVLPAKLRADALEKLLIRGTDAT